MSANNVWIIFTDERTWYGWDETAEEVEADKKHVREVSLSEAYTANSFDELVESMDDGFGQPEYGIHLIPRSYGASAGRLPKDHTLIRIVD